MSRLAAVLNAAALALWLPFCVPVVGRLAGQGLRIAQEGLAHAVGLAELLLGIVGVRSRKRLRVRVVILRTAGAPVTNPEALRDQVGMARKAFAAAGVELS